MPANQTTDIVATQGCIGNARTCHIHAACGGDIARGTRFGHIAILITNQTTDIVSANDVTRRRGIDHWCVVGIANQAADVITIAHVVHGTDIACSAGIGHAAATSRISNQATEVVVSTNHISCGADIGQRTVVIADQTTDSTFTALCVGSCRTIGQCQVS